MDYDILMLHTQSTKMPHTNCLIFPSTTITTTTTTTSTQSNFKLGETATSDFLQPSVPYSNVHLYSTYAENFDLSLLPQDCDTGTLNIPTTVYQYTKETTTKDNKSSTVGLTTPDIKIQQSWLQNDEVKQELKLDTFMPYSEQTEGHYQSPTCASTQTQNCEQQSQQKTSHLLIPPPAYPHVYPSPQSSPAQSEYCFPQSQFSGAYDSLSSSRTSLYASSPCPSIDAQSIKQELHILPPSPPESSCEVLSPDIEVKIEPLDNDVDFVVTDLDSLITKQEKILENKNNQLLCEYLQDTSFPKKHNIKPLALESFIGDLEAVRGDIEPVISLALQHAKREADETCRQLQISHDPTMWTPAQVHAWLRSTIIQFKLPLIENLAEKFSEDGAALLQLSEEEFALRVPESGNTLHAQLEIWKLACSDSYENNFSTTDRPEDTHLALLSSKKDALQKQQQNEQQQQQLSDGIWQESEHCLPNLNITIKEDNTEVEEDEEMLPTNAADSVPVPMSVSSPTVTSVATVEVKQPSSTPTGRTGGSHIHLWQFLKELLSAPHLNGTAIRWIDRGTGIFKIEDSVRVAKLWGRRKNRPAMNYDKLSRSIRQYYKKGIMKKTERSQRLVYQFCHPYHL